MSEKICPKHKIPMESKFHRGKTEHRDYQCPKCWNIICPEMSPRRTLRASKVYVSKNWHGDLKVEEMMRKENIPF